MASAILVAFLGASLCRSLGLWIHDLYWLQEDLGGEQGTHFAMGLSFTLAAWFLSAPLAPWPRLVAALVAAALLLGFDELAQAWFPTREFALEDYLWGLFGAVVAAVVGAVGTAARAGASGGGGRRGAPAAPNLRGGRK
ncbi:MAG: hypothetical protein KatS3mg124_0703 [Porticoccaceae bacterium]|nr:MAG: hypothetical protein KatS3mg124_0703 [Porticoccaceae bacterium]